MQQSKIYISKFYITLPLNLYLTADYRRGVATKLKVKITFNMASMMDCDQSTIVNLYSMTNVKKFGAWVAHVVSENSKS